MLKQQFNHEKQDVGHLSAFGSAVLVWFSFVKLFQCLVSGRKVYRIKITMKPYEYKI